MVLRTGILLLSFLTLHSLASIAQAPVSDERAVTILNQSLAASGTALNQVRAFTATGTITYFWAGERVEGPATVRARGHEQFRVDADLPSGTRSLALDRRSGIRKDSDGKLTPMPMHNTLSMGNSTFPYLSIAAALNDPAFQIAYIALVEAAGRQFHQLSVTKNFPKDTDPDGVLARLSRTDYFVDSQTLLVVKTADLTHPIETLTEDYVREVELEGYTAMSGVAVPTIIRQKIAGQTIWELRVSGITFNTSMTDSDFSIQ